jgi:hypothetical protein
MLPPEPEPLPQQERIIAVIDSCVFPRRSWLDPILLNARVGYVVPFWFPCIISEVNRFLTWQWLQRHGEVQSASSWRACSAASKKWFSIMTTVFRVVDDCPPPEPAWDSPRDEWDIPLWSAAKRCGASFIVTANLKDGPPADENGLRSFQGVTWIHPEAFAPEVDHWATVAAAGEDAEGDIGP